MTALARCDHAESLYGRCVACGMTWEQQAVEMGPAPHVAAFIDQKLRPRLAEGAAVQMVWDECERYKSRAAWEAAVLEDRADRDASEREGDL